MLMGDQIVEANLTDWRKLGQGLHARYLVGVFGTGVRFVAAVGEAGDALGHHPRVTMSDGYVDLKLLSDDAVYHDDEGTEHVVDWVTQQDVDLARRVTEIAAEQAVDADPASITTIELGLDTAHACDDLPGVGGPADREHRGPEPRDHRRRRPGTPRDGYQSCGSRTPTSTRPDRRARSPSLAGGIDMRQQGTVCTASRLPASSRRKDAPCRSLLGTAGGALGPSPAGTQPRPFRDSDSGPMMVWWRRRRWLT
ncbi:MAG: 4a-hydroxytetrahydrobiopterin dehydratase [Nocardioidaceae bacterium]